MKVIWLLMMIWYFNEEGFSQQLRVTIADVKNDNGKVGAALYDDDAQFMKKEIRAESVAAKRGEVVIIFKNVPAGNYAISILHDVNNNGKMDTNFLGIPVEGYGFSNDVMGIFGPPSFNMAKFVVNGKNQEVRIRMKYF